MDILKSLKAERVDIVEPDGMLRMSLYSSKHNPPLMMDGKDFLPGHRDNDGASGIRFYNSEGDECGGLGFSSRKLEDGGYTSTIHMAYDQYKNDQVVHITLSEKNGERRYGYHIFDRPNKHLKETLKIREAQMAAKNDEERKEIEKGYREENPARMFVGKETDGTVSARINDSKGRERIRMTYDASGQQKIEILDEEGKVTASLPAV